MRLTLLYGALFLATGAALVGTIYALLAGGVIVQQQGTLASGGPLTAQPGEAGPALALLGAEAAGGPSLHIRFNGTSGAVPVIISGTGGQDAPISQRRLAALQRDAVQLASGKLSLRRRQVIYEQLTRLGSSFLAVQLESQHRSDLSSLFEISLVVLGAMALLSIWLGWLISGRALRPLRTMTTRAQQISEHNLHERLALDGPDDELRELGDTFDGLLARLERAFEAQSRFVANASHELRTPLTVERAMLEVALADPDADTRSLREVCERVIALGEEQERLIEALLTLARSERGLERRETVDLSAVVARQVADWRARSPLTIDAEIEPAVLHGDRRLIERLVANLLDNAVRHNLAGGWVHVAVHSAPARLVVTNSGAAIASSDAERLLEPFRRAGGERTGQRDGHGLGLSIVAAIAEAHGGEVRVQALPEGGLEIEVSFGG